MPIVTKKARKAVLGKPRYITKDELRDQSRQVIKAMPVDPYGFRVWARGQDRYNPYAGPGMRKRAEQLFAKVFPQYKDYASAYGTGVDLSYATINEEKPLKPTPLNPDRKTNIGMWQSRNSVENSGRVFKVWAKAFDLGRRDGMALKAMHVAYRKTGTFPALSHESRVLTEGKTLTASDEEVSLEASIESIFHADGSSYFSPGAFDTAREQIMPKKSRTTLILMHPKAFLAMAKQLPSPNAVKTERVASAQGQFKDLPRLIFENNGDGMARVIGHEGRHRMYYLLDKGVQRVPVLFVSQPGSGAAIRWGSATGLDTVDPWPTQLYGENNSNAMPFPVSEIYPRSIVSDDIDYSVYGYWITNEGKFIAVDTEEHAETAYRWLKKNDPDTFEKLKDADRRVYDYQAFDTLMDRGWIHITNGRFSCEILAINRAFGATALRALRRYFSESTLEKISIIIQNHEANARPVRKIVTEPQQAMDFIRNYMKRDLTSWIEAAEIEIKATDREKHYGKSLYNQGKTDYLMIYRAVPRAEINFKPGDYVTLSKKFAIEHAGHVAAMGDPAHVIKIVADPRKVYDAMNPGEYFYGGEAKRGKVFYIAQQNVEGDDTMRRDLLASLQERMTKLEALSEAQTYTNKTKSVKLLYYANRSTPQTCKPGQTVKAKAGYGKRVKIKTATPEQVAQLKAGKWVRDRHDGKKPGEKGAKKTSYRPWLVASIQQKLEAAQRINSDV